MKRPLRLVVKVGTAVLLKDRQLDHGFLFELARQISALMKQGHEVILVSSGAVASGRELMRFEGEDPATEKRLLASVGQARLIHIYREAFERFGFQVSQILPLRSDFHDRRKFLALRGILERLAHHHVLPILNENDTLAAADLCFSDNDNLGALTAVAMRADRFIILTDIAGLYDRDPRASGAELIREVAHVTDAMKRACSGSMSGLGLGGMINKVLSAEMASRSGVETTIAYGRTPDVLLKIASGENPGTRFTANPDGRRHSSFSRKHWIACGVVPSGSIRIDSGAYAALKNRKSLLAVGIQEAAGDFGSGEVVTLLNPERVPVGTGISRYGSRRLARLNDLPAAERSAIAPHLFRKPVIHADDLVLW